MLAARPNRLKRVVRIDPAAAATHVLRSRTELARSIRSVAPVRAVAGQVLGARQHGRHLCAGRRIVHGCGMDESRSCGRP